MAGFALSAISLLIALGYLVLKLLHWEQMSFGLAPILIGFFFFASVQLFFIGLLGEYILQIHTQVQKRPLVIERERINFDPPMHWAPNHALPLWLVTCLFYRHWGHAALARDVYAVAACHRHLDTIRGGCHSAIPGVGDLAVVCAGPSLHGQPDLALASR
jgi:hypothetical protein